MRKTLRLEAIASRPVSWQTIPSCSATGLDVHMRKTLTSARSNTPSCSSTKPNNTQTLHGTAIYAAPLTPSQPPQLIGKYTSPMECLGHTRTTTKHEPRPLELSGASEPTFEVKGRNSPHSRQKRGIYQELSPPPNTAGPCDQTLSPWNSKSGLVCCS